MEKQVKIATNDGHTVYATVNRAGKRQKTLFLFIHGLSDNRDHRLVFNGARYFKTRGFDVARISLYTDELNGRILEECSIGTFVEDINSVLYHFKETYDHIYCVCHSLGFVTLDTDLTMVDGVVLWDPSLALKTDRIEHMRYEETLNGYIINWGVSFLIGKQLKIDWENISDQRLLKNASKPLCILMAAEGNLKFGWQENLAHISAPYYFKEIAHASHGFVEEGTEEELFTETLAWLQQMQKR